VDLASVAEQWQFEQPDAALDQQRRGWFIQQTPVTDERHLDAPPLEELQDLGQVGAQQRFASRNGDVLTKGFIHDFGEQFERPGRFELSAWIGCLPGSLPDVVAV
jgi:hypothetical protein